MQEHEEGYSRGVANGADALLDAITGKAPAAGQKKLNDFLIAYCIHGRVILTKFQSNIFLLRLRFE
jgi:hypothetical protein